MKNKQEEQAALRKAQKAQQKEQKNAKKYGIGQVSRKENSRKERIKLLIVCEGENTEPSYFEAFRYSKELFDIEIFGEGRNTVSLVKRAQELKNTPLYRDHQVWCVFDADPKPSNPKQLHNFNEAIRKATSLGFKVAYSHQAFEYWLLLHFEDHQGGPMDRTLYADKLNQYLQEIHPKAFYDEHKKLISKMVFDILQAKDYRTQQSRQDLAIQRARRIYDQHDHTNPAKTESSTTVFRLVELLIGK